MKRRSAFLMLRARSAACILGCDFEHSSVSLVIHYPVYLLINNSNIAAYTSYSCDFWSAWMNQHEIHQRSQCLGVATVSLAT